MFIIDKQTLQAETIRSKRESQTFIGKLIERQLATTTDKQVFGIWINKVAAVQCKSIIQYK
jgi:hypothetical protein